MLGWRDDFLVIFMKKVNWKEGAVEEILPFYGKAHLWYILISKLNKTTNQIKNSWRKYIFTELITSVDTYRRVIWKADQLENFSKHECIYFLFSFSIELLFTSMKQDRIQDIINFLRNHQELKVCKILTHCQPGNHFHVMSNSARPNYNLAYIIKWRMHEHLIESLSHLDLSSKIIIRPLGGSEKDIIERFTFWKKHFH
jgi:hypothetical protein